MRFSDVCCPSAITPISDRPSTDDNTSSAAAPSVLVSALSWDGLLHHSAQKFFNKKLFSLKNFCFVIVSVPISFFWFVPSARCVASFVVRPVLQLLVVVCQTKDANHLGKSFLRLCAVFIVLTFSRLVCFRAIRAICDYGWCCQLIETTFLILLMCFTVSLFP